MNRREAIIGMALVAIAPALPVSAERHAVTFAIDWWRTFIALSHSDQLRYAGILRRTDTRFNEMADAIEDWVAASKQV